MAKVMVLETPNMDERARDAEAIDAAERWMARIPELFITERSKQIQIGISGSLKRDMTCSPYIPGKGYPVEAKNIKKLLKAKDWNQMRIQAIGKEYTVWLQGEKVMTYKSDSAISEGPIGIQLHGNRNMSIDFRKLGILQLK